jgi:hypothetical protein
MAKDLTAALHALTVEAQGQTTRQDKALTAVKEATAIPERSGASGPVGSGTSGAIASPLTETAYADRKWYTKKNVLSSDGLFTMEVRCLEEIKFTDGARNEVLLKFKNSP